MWPSIRVYRTNRRQGGSVEKAIYFGFGVVHSMKPHLRCKIDLTVYAGY